MTDLKTIESEIQDLTQHAQIAEKDAVKARMQSESHRVGGDTSKASYESAMALKKQKEASDFSSKAQQKQKEAMSLRQEAQLVEKQISDLQQRHASITGDANSRII